MLYPSITPRETGFLDVGAGHSIYWEACGNPEGKPALFLHGGPGGGCFADHRRLFDPARYNIVLFDQRGCGRSRFVTRCEANTTQDLVDDIERLRVLLGVPQWGLVLGGSWGAALGLRYAQLHRARVGALVLRGVFSARKSEVDWLYQFGASQMFPEGWRRFLAPVAPERRGDMLSAYHELVWGADEGLRIAAARAWCAWEASLLTMAPRRSTYAASDTHVLALAEIETHYFVNDCFLPEGELLRQASVLEGLPGVIVQGRYDMVTPPTTAFELHQAWAGSRLEIVDDAGHATMEPGTMRKLIEATDGFAEL